MAPAFTDDQLKSIQGFGIAGFKKDNQETLFVKIGGADGGKRLLSWLRPQVSSAWEVGRFNEVFSEIRLRTGQEVLSATWLGVMISAAGYAALSAPMTGLPPGEGVNAFTTGMSGRKEQIGDTRPGDAPEGWETPFRPDVKSAHIAIVVAADEECDLNGRLVEIYEQVVSSGCEVVFRERGHTLPEPLTGHEHFGFKDGISQPAITDFDAAPANGEPAAVPAGEIVLGYPNADGQTLATNTIWENGSFVVFRRLLQDVPAFRKLEADGVAGASPTMSGTAFGARLIGRWPSGAPLELNADSDPGDGGVTNAFAFHATDDGGQICPVWAHIRKSNPRDETTPGAAADDPGHHRMLRRGIPFGPPLPPEAVTDDGQPRGLHFFSVVADLDRQFEFVQRNWLNNPNFPIGSQPAQPGGTYEPPQPGRTAGGPDPVVGEHDPGAQCDLVQAGGDHAFPVPSELVHVSAGEYLFLPSIVALGTICGG